MNNKTQKIAFTVEKTGSGYSAFANDYDVYTTGKDLAELKMNMKEAFDLHMEGEEKMEYELVPEFDIPLLFEYYKVINVSALSEILGMNRALLAQYINGHKKPSSKQTERIVIGVKKLGEELASLQMA